MNQSIVSVNLTLIGDNFDLDYVTETLKINPTYKRNREEILKNGRLFGHTEWGIGINYEVSDDINDQLNKLLDLVGGKQKSLLQLTKDCCAEWHILFVIKIENGDVPAMYFSKEFIHFASLIDAHIGFDTYVLSARDSETWPF